MSEKQCRIRHFALQLLEAELGAGKTVDIDVLFDSLPRQYPKESCFKGDWEEDEDRLIVGGMTLVFLHYCAGENGIIELPHNRFKAVSPTDP